MVEAFLESCRVCLSNMLLWRDIAGFWIYLYFRIRHSFAHLRTVILSADWSISRLQSWTCSSLSTVAEFVKLTQSIVIEIQRQSADLYEVQLCNRQFLVVSTAIHVVKVYECHPLDLIWIFISDVMLIPPENNWQNVNRECSWSHYTITKHLKYHFIGSGSCQ